MEGLMETLPSSPPAEHPRGTMAILVLYAIAFAAGFLAIYFLEFLKRGAPHP
jgi:hypothetical protein